MNENTVLLLRLGAALHDLGEQLEQRRSRIKALAEQDPSYESPELLQQLREYEWMKGRVASLEAQFESTKREIGDVRP